MLPERTTRETFHLHNKLQMLHKTFSTPIAIRILFAFSCVETTAAATAMLFFLTHGVGFRFDEWTMSRDDLK